MSEWSDRWAYSMAPGTMTNQYTGPANRDFGDNFVDAVNTAVDVAGYVPGLGQAANEFGDFVGDATDFVQDPSAGDFAEVFTPAVAEDLFDGGGLDDVAIGVPVVNDVVNGGGFQIPFGPTIGPNAPSSTPTTQGGGCPVGYNPNPNYNPAAATRSGANQQRCVPDATMSDSKPNASSAKPTTGGLDENCEEIPREYPPPVGCVPSTTAAESTFFKTQREGCQKEWKTLEKMEEEVKARYEQLCMAREKFNQRRERYGDLCGPYELLYGISEAKEREALEKEKAKRECLKKQTCRAGACGAGACGMGGGCGCAHKTSTGCGCGCSGKASTDDMDFEYEDPLKSACKRAVDDSFKVSAPKRVPPARAAKSTAKSSCMPCSLKSYPRKKTANKPKKPRKKTVFPVPTAAAVPKAKGGYRKAVTTKTGKRQCVQI